MEGAMPAARRAAAVVSAAAVLLVATVFRMGTLAPFTSTTVAGTSATVGSVAVVLGGATNRLTVGVADLVPGDSMQRSFDLRNDSALPAQSTLTTTASPSSKLDSDPSQGLQMILQRCSVPWTESSAAPYSYTCGGTTTTVLASRPVIGAGLTLNGLASGGGGTDHLRLTLSLPSGADDSFQALTSTIIYSFTTGSG
jgi:spore coat-associated protein N